MGQPNIPEFSVEDIAEWFLRLNGFLTVRNFVIHPVNRRRGSQQTDADVLGIRFPERKETVGGEDLADHAEFQNAKLPVFVIAEVKKGNCAINEPWRDQDAMNVTNVIRSFGRMSVATPDEISNAIYSTGRFQGADLDARQVCFGSTRSEVLLEGVLQFEWIDVFEFAFDRFERFRRAKSDHQQWPGIGHYLWEESKSCDRARFVDSMCSQFGVTRSGAPPLNDL